VTRLPIRNIRIHKLKAEAIKGLERRKRLTPLPLKATISEFLASNTNVIRTEAKVATGAKRTITLGI
jgi:hypothetical protein